LLKGWNIVVGGAQEADTIGKTHAKGLSGAQRSILASAEEGIRPSKASKALMRPYAKRAISLDGKDLRDF
jgi:hypothetical protein